MRETKMAGNLELDTDQSNPKEFLGSTICLTKMKWALSYLNPETEHN